MEILYLNKYFASIILSQVRVFLSFSCPRTFKLEAMEFYDAVLPVHSVSKLSGLTIFSINPKNFEPTFSKLDLVLIIMTILINYQLNNFFWSLFNLSSRYNSPIIKTSLPILYYGKYLINVLSIIWSIAMRKKIAKLLQMFHDVDKMVKILYNFLKY